MRWVLEARRMHPALRILEAGQALPPLELVAVAMGNQKAMPQHKHP